jgi:microcystin-dependent protein
VDWEPNQPQPAAGEEHIFAPLALVRVQANGTIASPAVDIVDMRKVFPTLRSLGGQGGAIVTGTGTAGFVPKWQGNAASNLVNSSISDDGTRVLITEPLAVTFPVTLHHSLRVGTGGGDAAITAFTSTAIQNLSAADLGVTVPTAQAVKNFMNLSIPPGTVMAYASEIIPPGWLECNGASLNGANPTFAALFAAIGKAFGSGNGNPAEFSFNLPDLRGRFIRGWAHGSGNDPDVGLRIASGKDGQAGDHVGSVQNDEFKSHTHGLHSTGPDPNTQSAELDSGSKPVVTGIGFASLQPSSEGIFLPAAPVPPNLIVEPSGGNESRPKNIFLTYIIKL